MRLRNKKTGEIKEFDCVNVLKNSDCTLADYVYRSLAELNSEWEDYEPKEPLIKDEKLRKVVRTWAEIAQSEHVQYDDSYRMLYTQSDFTRQYSISFPMGLELDEMTDYTIDELCGEEEE